MMMMESAMPMQQYSVGMSMPPQALKQKKKRKAPKKSGLFGMGAGADNNDSDDSGTESDVEMNDMVDEKAEMPQKKKTGLFGGLFSMFGGGSK